MVACSCGVDNPEGARYCPSCGRSIGDDFQLLDVSRPGSAVVIESSIAPEPLSRHRWLAAGVASCMMLLLVTLWTGSDDPAPTERAEGQDALVDDTSDGEPERSATTTTTVDEQASSTIRRTTTTLPEFEVIGDGSPLLGEPVGYRLVVGTGRSPMVLDLDSGELHRSAEPGSADPVMVSGDWLVVRSNDRLAVLPLDDLGAESRNLQSDARYIEVASRSNRSDGRIWTIDYSRNVPSLDLIDLASGDVVETVALEQLGNRYGSLSADTDGVLVSVLGSGVYRPEGEGFRRVADGWLLASDATRILVSTCDDQLRCGYRWLDRQSGRPLDLVVPEGRIDEARLVNGTDWLATIEYSSAVQRAGLFNAVTGQAVDLIDSNSFWEVGPAISPEGRWLAEQVGAHLHVTELATGDVSVIEGISGMSGRFVFVAG